MRLQTRLQRLEGKQPQSDGKHVALVVNEAEAEEVRCAHSDRHILIIHTGVQRPDKGPRYLSWDRILPAVAKHGRSIIDPSIAHAENWRTDHGPRA